MRKTQKTNENAIQFVRFGTDTKTSKDKGGAQTPSQRTMVSPISRNVLDTPSLSGRDKRTGAELKVLSHEGVSLNEDIKVEYGHGIGETKDEAIKEAMRDVLQKVVGVYVDSDFRMNNDEIIKDEVITHSKGLIDHYKQMEVETAPDGRGIAVTIKAWVKVRDFVNQMKTLAPAQDVSVDGALMDSVLGNQLNAESLLLKVIQGVHPIRDLMEISLFDNYKPVVQSSTEDTVTMRYVYCIRYSKEKYYKQFAPNLVSVLDQIADCKGRDRNFQMTVVPIKYYPNRYLGSAFDDLMVPGYVLLYPDSRNDKKNRVYVATRISNSGLVSYREWELSSRLKELLEEWEEENRESTRWVGCTQVKCTLLLSRADGQLLGCGESIIPYDYLVRKYFGYYHSRWGGLGSCAGIIPLVTPENVKMSEGSYDKIREAKSKASGFPEVQFVDKFVGYVDVTIGRADIADVKSARITLEVIE